MYDRDIDPAIKQVDSYALKKSRHRSFARAVCSRLTKPAISRQTGNSNQLSTTLFKHFGQHRGDTIHRPNDIDAEHFGYVFRIKLSGVSAAANSGIRNHDVNPAEFTSQAIGRRADISGIAHIRSQGHSSLRARFRLGLTITFDLIDHIKQARRWFDCCSRQNRPAYPGRSRKLRYLNPAG